MSVLISVRDLYRSFEQRARATAVLRGVGFDVSEGEFLCIMGPSGSGKTTLLHLLSGIDQPSAGSLEVQGKNLAKLDDDATTRLRREVFGYVFQFFNLMPNLSLIENISLPLAIAGRRPQDAKDELEALLRRFDLVDRRDAMPHELSGGEMQRCSIARALAGGQPILLCDEPTGNLSQSAGLRVVETLREICDRDKKTIVLVTHNPRDAAFADRLLFLVDGKLAEDATLRKPEISVERIHEALSTLKI